MNPQNPKAIPNRPPGSEGDISGMPPINVNPTNGGSSMIAETEFPNHTNWIASYPFKDQTIHFAFDSSVVRSADKSKINEVADYLKGNPQTAVRVEGNCDERGTEEYNRSLGERRALAAREVLVGLGIAPDRVDTVSYGQDKPVAEGHNEAAWQQNRRDDFTLLTPPGK
jgi:peptidoglycan-associated lipoprotein